MLFTNFRLLSVAALFLIFLPIHQAFAQANLGICGSLKNGFGPYEYRPDHHKPDNQYDHRPHKFIMNLVQGAHFTPEVETLVRGKSGSIGADIDYTLRAIPNNHRALIAMMRLGEKEKTTQPKGSTHSVECWFTRAIQFSPDDSIVRMIYSTYLNSNGRIPEANSQLDIASTYAKDNPFTNYNLGLHYFDLKNYDRALLQAHQAIAQGFPQTALREQLQNVGKWSEPVAPTTLPPIEAANTPALQIK